MKKLTKILGVLTLLFSLFASLGSIAMETAMAQEEATVTLHKKKMTELPTLFQNTGEEMPHFDQYDDYEMGAEFDVYDVTTEFYAARAAGMTVEEAFGAINNTPTPGITPIDSGVTDDNGLLSFTLDKTSGGRDAVYLFAERDIAGTIIAENFVLSFPVYALEDGEYTDRELNDIHLYPKNVVDADGRLLVTKRGTANNETLNGAMFNIQSAQTDRYLSGAVNGLFTWSDDETSAYEFETGYSYSIGDAGIVRTDSAVNHGELGILGFEPGDYRLIETIAPDNAAIIDAETTKDFTITANQEVGTAVTVNNDTIDIDKDIDADIRDYNVGDLIPYIGSVNIPMGIGDRLANDAFKHPALIITDVPEAGLMFNNDLNVTINGVAFDISGMLASTTNGFVLTIPASALLDFAGEDLDLSYNMYLDGSAVPDLGYNNTIDVDTGLLEDEDDTDDVYTGGMRFIKLDANFDENNALAGATFVVRDDDGANANYLAIGANNAVDWVTDLADATEFTSDGDGFFEVAGLEYGTYFLEETVAPEDYVLLDDLVEFEIAQGSFTTEIRFDVMNIRKGRLPSTGGTGIMGIIGLGAVLVLTTGGYYIKRQRQA